MLYFIVGFFDVKKFVVFLGILFVWIFERDLFFHVGGVFKGFFERTSGGGVV